MNRKGLEEKREELKVKMSEIIETAQKESRALNEEEINEFDACEKEVKNVDSTIEREDKMNSMEEKKEVVTEVPQEEKDVKDFAEYIRCVAKGMETRADVNMAKGDNGAMIPKTIIAKIIAKIEEISPVYRLATHYNIAGTVNIPKEDNSVDSITVAYGTEFTDLESHANKFATIELTGYIYGALTKISRSLLNNSDFNLTEWVIDKMSAKIAKFIEGELLNGTADKTSGVARSYDNTNMKKVLASKTAITADELIDTQDLVPDAYQNNAIWVMKKSTRNAIRKLKNSDGDYLLNKDINSQFGYTLLGKDVYCSDSVEALGAAQASKNVIFYGDFSGLAVKESETPQVQVLREKYATQHAIGVVAWGEIDAKVEDTQKLAVVQTAV